MYPAVRFNSFYGFFGIPWRLLLLFLFILSASVGCLFALKINCIIRIGEKLKLVIVGNLYLFVCSIFCEKG
jgi:hypothetical protein